MKISVAANADYCRLMLNWNVPVDSKHGTERVVVTVEEKHVRKIFISRIV